MRGYSWGEEFRVLGLGVAFGLLDGARAPGDKPASHLLAVGTRMRFLLLLVEQAEVGDPELGAVLRSFQDRCTVTQMKTSMPRRTMASAITAFVATWLPLAAAHAEAPQRARGGNDLQQELDRLEQQRFNEQLRRAREADRTREADRARRARETQEREAQAAERNRETRAREEREAASLQAVREAERERTAKRGRNRRDPNVPTPPSR